MGFELYLYHQKSADLTFHLTICPGNEIDDDAIFDEKALNENHGEIVVQNEEII